jgi:hypothetical protein
MLDTLEISMYERVQRCSTSRDHWYLLTVSIRALHCEVYMLTIIKTQARDAANFYILSRVPTMLLLLLQLQSCSRQNASLPKCKLPFQGRTSLSFSHSSQLTTTRQLFHSPPQAIMTNGEAHALLQLSCLARRTAVHNRACVLLK